VIVPHLPPEVPGGGAGRVWPVRRIIEAILYLDRTGCAWRYPPADFLPDDVRVLRLCDNSTLARLHDALRGQVRQAPGRHSEPTAAVVDSQSFRAAQTVPK
jgi:transposase